MTSSSGESKQGRVAAPSAVPARRRWWREVLYALAFYLVYSYIRNHFGSAAVSPDEAFANARKVIDVERFLGLYHEPAIQGWFVHATGNGLAFGFAGARALMHLWNILYGTLHFVVTAGALVWLYRRFGSDYPMWRNTLAFTTGLALLVYGLYPLMPPRLLPDCGAYGACLSHYPYVDSLATIGGLWSFDSGTMQSISNQYAAMPSLHFAWASWAFLALRPRLVHRWSRVAITVYPWLTLWVIVVTANHFWLDAAGGAAVLAVAYAAARAVEAGWARIAASRAGSGDLGAGVAR